MSSKTPAGIAYFEFGPTQGTPLVLIHGFPLSHAMWDAQIKALSTTHRVIAYDIRGFGASDVGTGQASIEFFVDDLMGVLDALKVDKAILCGLSMGGYIALRAVERHPERVERLILCDTRSEADSNEAKVKRAKAVQSIQKDGIEPFAKEFVKGVLAAKTLESKPEIVKILIHQISKNSVVGICGALIAMAARTDTTEALPKIKVPTLILVGEEDKLTPPDSARKMAGLIPQSKLEIIPGAAHMSNLENPDVFNAKIAGFLKA